MASLPTRPLRTTAVVLFTMLLVLACSGPSEPDEPPPPADTDVEEDPEEPPPPEQPEADDEPEQEPEEEPEPEVDPAEVGADELGFVPVLMYHRLREDGGSVYDLTADEFREELEWLFDNGYSPVRVKDLVRGEFDVPAGRSPVVLTFDDSTSEQAQLTDDGELDPDTSMGILVDVASDYDEVEPLASLYVITSSLFGGTADGPHILAHLHEIGMEIGNHTHNHPNLGRLSADEVRTELATNVEVVADIAPDAEVVTLSLPLGVFPEDRALAVEGSADVGEYRHEAILLVGANPAHSPFAAEFDPMATPRIRSSPAWDGGEPDFGSAFWLEQLDAGGQWRRYVSDGNPSTISFPEEHADELDPAFEDRANPY